MKVIGARTGKGVGGLAFLLCQSSVACSLLFSPGEPIEKDKDGGDSADGGDPANLTCLAAPSATPSLSYCFQGSDGPKIQSFSPEGREGPLVEFENPLSIDDNHLDISVDNVGRINLDKLRTEFGYDFSIELILSTGTYTPQGETYFPRTILAIQSIVGETILSENLLIGTAEAKKCQGVGNQLVYRNGEDDTNCVFLDNVSLGATPRYYLLSVSEERVVFYENGNRRGSQENPTIEGASRWPTKGSLILSLGDRAPDGFHWLGHLYFLGFHGRALTETEASERYKTLSLSL